MCLSLSKGSVQLESTSEWSWGTLSERCREYYSQWPFLQEPPLLLLIQKGHIHLKHGCCVTCLAVLSVSMSGEVRALLSPNEHTHLCLINKSWMRGALLQANLAFISNSWSLEPLKLQKRPGVEHRRPEDGIWQGKPLVYKMKANPSPY